MATKNTKSVGSLIKGQSREYWVNAAKQFIWPIDFTDFQILVPEKDLELANNNLMVSHFRAAGWHIQSAISVEYTKPYVAPESNGNPIFKPIKKEEPVTETAFKLNDKFRVVSTGCELAICLFDKQKIHLKYLNRPNKHNIISSEENLSRTLKMGTWIKL